MNNNDKTEYVIKFKKEEFNGSIYYTFKPNICFQKVINKRDNFSKLNIDYFKKEIEDEFKRIIFGDDEEMLNDLHKLLFMINCLEERSKIKNEITSLIEKIISSRLQLKAQKVEFIETEE